MKKLMLGALLMIGMTSFAQEEKPLQVRPQKEMTPEQREQNHLKRLTTELNLDAAQQKELAAILSDGTAKKQAMKSEQKADREAKRSEMDAFRTEQDAKIKKLLKGDQLAKWEKIKAVEKQRREDKKEQRSEKTKKAE